MEASYIECFSKNFKVYFYFYRVHKVLTHEALVVLFNSLVYPHLTYCNSAWCNGPKSMIGKLFIAKKKL